MYEMTMPRSFFFFREKYRSLIRTSSIHLYISSFVEELVNLTLLVSLTSSRSCATLPMLESFMLICITLINLSPIPIAFNGPHLGLICVGIVNDLGILLYWTRLVIDFSPA